MQPLSGNSKEVTHNFGSAGKHLGTGTNGTYPLYADAYRKAAEEIGIKPRELQSVVWEHVRNMFPSEWKSPENEAVVKGIWKKYSDGKQSLNKTRQQIVDLSEQAQKQVSDARAEAQKKAAQKQLDKQAKKQDNVGVEAGAAALRGAQ
jgi:dsDNA-specific endonuclease/ATPase MutS2